jgi:hypothetical protein
MVCAPATSISPDEPGIDTGAVSTDGAPEIVIALAFEYRHYSLAGLCEAAYLHKHIDNRFSAQTWHRGAAKVLNADEQISWQTTSEMCSFGCEQFWPSRIVLGYFNRFLNDCVDSLLETHPTEGFVLIPSTAEL